MIFNTIQKQLQNFIHQENKNKNKCSICYLSSSKSKNHVEQQLSNRQLKTKRQYQYNHHHALKSLEEQDNTQRKIPIKQLVKLSNQTPHQTLKSKQNRKDNSHTKSKSRKKIYTQQNPQKQWTKNNDNKHIKPTNKKKTNKQKSPTKYHRNYRKTSSSLDTEPNQPQQQNTLSQTIKNIGNQLYELSPIHFNKYLQYINKHPQKNYPPNGQYDERMIKISYLNPEKRQKNNQNCPHHCEKTARTHQPQIIQSAYQTFSKKKIHSLTKLESDIIPEIQKKKQQNKKQEQYILRNNPIYKSQVQIPQNSKNLSYLWIPTLLSSGLLLLVTSILK